MFKLTEGYDVFTHLLSSLWSYSRSNISQGRSIVINRTIVVQSNLDIGNNKDNDKLNALFDSSLKISNNDHIHDITMSDIWIEFYTMLQDQSQEKPRFKLQSTRSLFYRGHARSGQIVRSKHPLDRARGEGGMGTNSTMGMGKHSVIQQVKNTLGIN